MSQDASPADRNLEGYVKRVFDCGHWILILDYFERHNNCPVCHRGNIEEEVDPSAEDFREAEWI